MSSATTLIGPHDHGKAMSLDEFETIQAQAGYLYELSRGIITVVDVPRPSHGGVVAKLRRILTRYQDNNPDRIYDVYSGNECKILLVDLQSERHPDLAVYTSPPPSDDAEVWAAWIPDLVVEVVSADSIQRDYEEKPEEYLAFGVREYWIADPLKMKVTVHMRRAGKWQKKVVARGKGYDCGLFPGLHLDVAAVFE